GVDDAPGSGVGLRVPLAAAPPPQRRQDQCDPEQECEDSEDQSARSCTSQRSPVFTILCRGTDPASRLDGLCGPRSGAQDPGRRPPAPGPGPGSVEGGGLQGSRCPGGRGPCAQRV